jgi:Ni/Co efflux regulator RcnB
MRKIALAIAALAIAGFAAPNVQSANAETIVVKKDRDHDRDWGRHHHKKVVIIKHRRGHRDHD